jgi:hypothetical protein
MLAMHLDALWTFRFLAAEGCAECHANRYADAQPYCDVSGHNSEHRAQRCS